MSKFPSLKRLTGAAILCAAVMAYAATPAHAALELWISDGATSVLVGPSGTGGVTYSCSPVCPFAGWTSVLLTASGTGSPFGGLAPDMDLSISGGTVAGAAPLTFELKQDGNLTSPAVFSMVYANVAPDGSVGTATMWLDGTNSLCAVVTGCVLGALEGTTGPLTAPDLKKVVSLPYFGATPYGYTIKLALAPTAGLLSQDVHVRTSLVPEPTSMALLGSGLLWFGRSIRRRMRKA